MPPLSYDLTEPPSLLQIDSKMSLGVQTMGLPHCSTAFSEPFVLDRCRVSLLFDATSKSHADRSQRSAGYFTPRVVHIVYIGSNAFLGPLVVDL